MRRVTVSFALVMSLQQLVFSAALSLPPERRRAEATTKTIENDDPATIQRYQRIRAPQYGPRRVPFSAPYPPQPSHADTLDCAVCPQLEAWNVYCRQSDTQCCVVPDEPISNQYVYMGQACPSRFQLISAPVCNALEANPAVVQPGTRVLPAGDTSTIAPWTSDRYASLVAVVSIGLCMNVYPDVEPGDYLYTACSNPTIGPEVEVLVNLSQGASIATGGNLIFTTSRLIAPIPGSVIVLGDFTVLASSNNNIVIANSEASSGSGAFSGVGALFAGEITFADAVPSLLIDVTNGDSLTSSGIYDSLFTSPPSNINAQEVQDFRDSFDAYLCSALSQVTGLPENGEVEFTDDNGDGFLQMEVTCPSTGDGVCTVTASAFDLALTTTMIVTINSFDSIIVRVFEEGTLHFSAPSCLNIAGCRLIFALLGASEVTLEVADAVTDPSFPMFAPVASSVTVIYSTAANSLVQGGIIAPSGSTTTLIGAYSMGVWENLGEIFELPETLVSSVVFCDCACDPGNLPVTELTKECAVGKYGLNGPYHFH